VDDAVRLPPRRGQERDVSAPFRLLPHLSLALALALALALSGFALAATAIGALAVRTLATRTGFVFNSSSIHNVLRDYGGMPWSKG